jgi:hypothetical protein
MTAAAVLNGAGPDASGELRVLALSQLIESPWNPRKHYALLKAVLEQVKTLPLTAGGVLWQTALRECTPHRLNKVFNPGSTAESLLRYCVFQHVAAELTGFPWDPAREWRKLLKPLGVDAEQIVDQVAPKPAPERKPAKKGRR